MNVTEVIRLAGSLVGDQDNIIIKPQDFFDYINDGQTRILQETDARTSQIIGVASDYPIEFPGDILIGKQLLYGRSNLPKISVEELEIRQIDRTAIGAPQWYYYFNGAIRLFPTPESTDKTVTIFYYCPMPKIVTDVSVGLDIPVGFHNQLVQFVIARCHERLQNQTASERAMREFDKTLSIRKEVAALRDDSFAVVRDDPWDDW